MKIIGKNQDLYPLVNCKNCKITNQKGLKVKNDILIAEEIDSWFEVKLSFQSSFIYLNIECNETYYGDRLTLYYALEEDDGFTEQRTVIFNLDRSNNVERILKFESPVKWLRIDPSECPCITGITKIAIIGRRFILHRPIFGLNQNNVPILKVQDGSPKAIYNNWLSGQKTIAKKNFQANFEFNPYISIVVPLYHTPTNFLKDLVNSVMSQYYQNWELILVNSTPEDTTLNDDLATYANSDKRIKVKNLSENLGISNNTNAGVKEASGDYLAFIDHDDFIEENALSEYIAVLQEHRNIDVLYCDEDKYYPDGSFNDPRFKPDFNLYLLRNNNYICHMIMIKKSIFNKLGGFESAYDGAQDHHLLLKAAAINASFYHIPRVLYHWRISSTSTADNDSNKPYALEAGRAAVQNHLDILGVKAKVTNYERPFTYKISYEITKQVPITICIRFSGNSQNLKNCIQELYKSAKSLVSSIVVFCLEDQVDPVQNVLQSFKINKSCIVKIKIYNSKLVLPETVGTILFLTDKIKIINSDCIEMLLGYSQQPNICFVAPRIMSSNGSTLHSGQTFGKYNLSDIGENLQSTRICQHWFYSDEDTKTVSAVSAECFMVDVSKLNSEFAIYDDIFDVCLKAIEYSYINIYAADAIVVGNLPSKAMDYSIAKPINDFNVNSNINDFI